MFRTGVLFSFKHSNMYWICEESSFIRRLFTTSFGFSSPQMRRNFFQLVTVSTSSSRISYRTVLSVG